MSKRKATILARSLSEEDPISRYLGIHTRKYAEMTLTAVPDHAFTFKLHMKVTHFGADLHTNNFQDFPAVYCNLEDGKLVIYENTLPWSNGALSFSTLTDLGDTHHGYIRLSTGSH